jgi:hypothetical protein
LSENNWATGKKVAGFLTIHDGKEMLSLGIEEAKCGEDGKIIAIFGEAGGKWETETVRDLKRVIDCVNYFVGIENVREWVKANQRDAQQTLQPDKAS